jgi:hypothetical protein
MSSPSMQAPIEAYADLLALRARNEKSPSRSVAWFSRLNGRMAARALQP